MVEHHHEPQTQTHDEDSRNSCIMARFKESLISQDSSLSSSFIQRRLEQLFISFDTPTHPPYALMIHRAIMELNEETGSTEDAISEFVKREYQDLPWAHVKILGLHLKKLCQVGELACIEGGRYVLLGETGGKMGGVEETEQCSKGGNKRKKGKKRRNDHGDGERKGTVESFEGVEIESRNGLLQKEGIREENQVCDEPSGVVEWTQEKGERECKHSIGRVEERTESGNRRLKVVLRRSQRMEAEAPAPNELQVSQNRDSIPLTQLQQQMSRQGPSESSLDAAAKSIASLSSLNVKEHKHGEKPMSGDPEKKHPYHFRGRPCKSMQNEEYQKESLLPSGDDDAIVIPQKPNVKQISLENDLGKVSKTQASLACVDVHDDKHPQHCSQGNLNENPMFEKKPLKRPRGRPPKLETAANHTGESLLSTDDGIDNKQNPNMNRIEKQYQYGQGKGRGRPRNANQCDEPLRLEDQALQHGQVRGRGRPRKLNQNIEQCEEQLQKEYQAKQCGRGRGRGRPPKLNRNTN